MLVEYTDPSNVYQSISRDLAKRLPLRNLHWNSSTRPLRSIKSLHVDLVPDERRQSQHTSPPPSREGLGVAQDGTGDGVSDRPKGNERPASGAASSARKERRHQIPGLRETPYLKVYLLRCEDLDSYKTVSRKAVREWVKEHTPPSQKSSRANNQEYHDAFEWLIIHVISPEDKAAQRSNDTKASSRRDPSQLVVKIRTDFNGTSKSAVDRVAQIQLNEGQPGTTPLGQNPQDGDTGWGDLIFKLKSLILASFDLRVRQYEEDLKEKESQRSLPGWNFNTFFVLKEGLARGFESVGLVEDALTSYHELSVGLQSVLEGPEEGQSAPPTANSLRSFTDDIADELKRATNEPSGITNGTPGEEISVNGTVEFKNKLTDLGSAILDTGRKSFRELILANQISAFDFQCYIFARQVALLLRLANASSTASGSTHVNQEDTFDKYDSQSKSGTPIPRSSIEPENLPLLADICRRAVEFIVYTCGTMRDDLNHAADCLREQNLDQELSSAAQKAIMDNLVGSWSCSVAGVILQRTQTQSLTTQLQPLLRQLQPHTSHDSSSAQTDGVKSSLQRQSFPDRTSSLSPSSTGIMRPPNPEKYPSVTSLDAMRLLPPGPVQTGSSDLAAHRADLMFLKRRTLRSLGARCGGWKAGMPALIASQALREDDMEDVSLDDVSEELHKNAGITNHETEISSSQGIRNAALQVALNTEQAFFEAYESLTASTLALYVLGERRNSAEAMTTDIAAVRFQVGDYPAAASYFRQLAPFYAKGGWTSLELLMLDLYAQCLNKLERNDEYVGIALKILAKQVQGWKAELDEANVKSLSSRTLKPGGGVRYLEDAVAVSRSLQSGLSVPIDHYFGEAVLDPQIRHQDNKDGFSMHLSLHHVVEENLMVDEVKIRLVGVDEDQRSELLLSQVKPPCWKSGLVTIVALSQVMQPGLYTLDKILIHVGNITFHQDTSAPEAGSFELLQNGEAPVGFSATSQKPRVHVYPQPKAFEARAEHSKDIHLEKTRSIEITLSSGWNSISSGKLSVRAGTAGLRLHTAKAEVAGCQLEISDSSKPGLLGFGELAAESNIKIIVPYTVENDLKDITVRLEVTYTTEYGDFVFACAPSISILLPLGVNVQDIFNKKALFSKFSIFTANAIPLRLIDCKIEGTDDFQVQSPPLERGLDIFSRQPISLLAKITAKSRQPSGQPLQRKLLLQITYTCLDEEVSTTISNAFTTSLSTSPFSHLLRLLLPTIPNPLTGQDIETTALLRSITLPPYQSSTYASILPAIPPSNHQALLHHLHTFHTTHTTIPLSPTPSKPHTLTIPVEIPTLSVLHTATLTLPPTHPVHLNTPLPAELRISHTRAWGTDAAPNASLDFVYEVSAPADTWLIGGQRRAHFLVGEGEEVMFALLLLPQRTGYLLYPGVEVWHVPAGPEGGEGSGGGVEGQGGEALSCETDYKSQAKSVHVVAGLSRTTVVVDHEAPERGAWVVEAEEWGEA